VAKWEGELDQAQLSAALGGEASAEAIPALVQPAE
jgi:aerobic C4-dicarboxylate transport protein